MGVYIALIIVLALVLIFYITAINKRNGLKDSFDKLRYGRGFERVEGFIMLCFWGGNTIWISVMLILVFLKIIGFYD